MDRNDGNIIANCYSRRCDRNPLLIEDCEDISITNFKIQNWNNDFATHATDFPAVEIDGSIVSIDGLQTRVYGASASDFGVRLSNSSTVDLQRTSIADFNVSKFTKDAGSVLEDITPDSGTFTPTIAGSATPGAHTYSVQVGVFRRTGKEVFVKLSVLLSAKDGAMAGNVEIRGIPFTAETSTAESHSQVKYNDIALTSGQECVGSVTTGTKNINLYRTNFGAAGVAFTIDSAQIGNGTRVDVSFTYLTSDLE
jgi:hypothetical protein